MIQIKTNWLFAFLLTLSFGLAPIHSVVAQAPAVQDPPATEAEQDQEDAESEADSTESDDAEESDRAKEEPETERKNKIVPAYIRNSKRASGFVDLFKPIVGSASASTVVVNGGRRQIAMGTVVGSEGFILTKASELRGKLKVTLQNGDKLEAKVIGIDPATDLALLKVDAAELPSVKWSNDPTPTTGRWLATPRRRRQTYRDWNCQR